MTTSRTFDRSDASQGRDPLVEHGYTYDAAGGMTQYVNSNDGTINLYSLTDPENNTTTWLYDLLGRCVQETNPLDADSFYTYDAAGNLLAKTDRNGRVTSYEYDLLGNNTSEQWLDAQQNVLRTFSYTYDLVGDLLGASDPTADYDYAYNVLGRVASITQGIDGLTPTVVFEQQFDVLGDRTQLATTIGATADFTNDYTYNGLGEMLSVAQHGAIGGNAVAEKLVQFTYNSIGQFDTITRYANLAGTQLVATGTYGYDLAGRLNSLTYAKGQTTLVDYDWTYDAANRMTQYVNSIDGTVDYTNDDTGQLTGADYDYQTDESYTYDDNGNRTNAGYVTGANNQLLSDGTYRYAYDAEGNRTLRFVDADASGSLTTGDTEITEYAWDYRNRLTTVANYEDYAAYTAETPEQVVEYAYDFQNRLVGKTLDADGDGTADASTAFIYDGGQIALQFDKTGATGSASASDLSHRYGAGRGSTLGSGVPSPTGRGPG